jgi:hypothetical protein
MTGDNVTADAKRWEGERKDGGEHTQSRKNTNRPAAPSA